MPSKSASKTSDKEQSKRFIEAARKAGADESKEGADKAFKKVASSKTKRASQRS